MDFCSAFFAGIFGGKTVEDRFKKAQREMSDAANAMMSDWLNQMWEKMSRDPVMGQLWSAMNTGTQAVQQSGIEPYRVLGLDKSDADDQVKRRYREMAVRLHPDTAGVKGTEFLFQLVTAAYQQISRERGW